MSSRRPVLVFQRKHIFFYRSRVGLCSVQRPPCFAPPGSWLRRRTLCRWRPRPRVDGLDRGIALRVGHVQPWRPGSDSARLNLGRGRPHSRRWPGRVASPGIHLRPHRPPGIFTEALTDAGPHLMVVPHCHLSLKGNAINLGDPSSWRSTFHPFFSGKRGADQFIALFGRHLTDGRINGINRSYSS